MQKIGIGRLVSVGLLLLLLSGLGWILTVLFGNPLVRLTLGGRVNDYLQTRYPGTAFVREKTVYDFLSRRYVVRMRPAGEPEVSFRVSLGRDGRPDRDDYRETVLARNAQELFTPVVQTVLPGATVNARTVPADSDETGPASTIAVSVSWESDSAEPEAFVGQAMSVLAAVQRGSLQAGEYHFWCTVGEDRDLALTVYTGQHPLDKAELLARVAKPGKW